MKHLGKRKGAVLIIVLGVLAVLALLATTFYTLQTTERNVSRNYLDTVRAKLLAQSGVQDAESRLRQYFPGRYFSSSAQPEPKPWKYWGQDKTELKEPKPDDRLEEAVSPSFAIEADPQKNIEEQPVQNPLDRNVNPKTIKIEGKDRGLSGVGGHTYASRGDNYVLKVTDLSGRIYVNDGIDGGPSGSVSQNLKRILNSLGEQSSVKISELGEKIVGARPTTGYRSMQDVLRAVGYDELLFNKFRNFITVYAWVDPNVCNPVPLSEAKANLWQTRTGVKFERGAPGIYRFGSTTPGADAEGDPVDIGQALDTRPDARQDDKSHYLYGLDTLNPQWIEIVSRAPVNINAAPHEVLVALLKDLQGWFVADRRRNNPKWQGDKYLSFKGTSTFSPELTEGDEIGFLTDTAKIVLTSGTGEKAVMADQLAQEIIACRNRAAGAVSDYRDSKIWWSGPFQSWHQFYAFIDSLVGEDKLIWDWRQGDYHLDYPIDTDVVDPYGYYSTLKESAYQRKFASQAIADMIKANFNPNLHLNEMNPDANMHLIVDKTDLHVHSTEFCFMPTGYFEVESLGRILRPVDPKVTDAYNGDNTIVAQAKVTATYKLYDMYRETTQKQFYPGEIAPNGGVWPTNNDLSLEVGPEPDNGIFPGNLDPNPSVKADNEWGGYIALPTLGGVFGSGGAPPKKKNTLIRTLQLPDIQQMDCSMYVPFTLDYDAAYHIVDRNEISSRTLPDEEVSNHPDYLNSNKFAYPGPYDPTDGPQHRMARSFRLDVNKQSGTVAAPSLQSYVPSDLRIDGGYVERHAAPAYYNVKGVSGIWNFNTDANAKGMVSLWWKPSYSPDRTGKVRAIWDMSRFHDPCDNEVHVWPFALWFFPVHWKPNDSLFSKPTYSDNSQKQFRMCSLTWGSKQWHSSRGGDIGGQNGQPSHHFGRMTHCLNHLTAVDDVVLAKNAPNPLRAHVWIHTTMLWNLQGNDADGTTCAKMFVDGTETYSEFTHSSMWQGRTGDGYSKMSYFDKHDGGANNHIRLGGTSQISKAATEKSPVVGGYRGNHSGDHTVDEVYSWKDPISDPTSLWTIGRYYLPSGGYKEGRFTSQALSSMITYVPRQLPPPTTAPAPGGGGAPRGISIPAEGSTVRILGVSWTWFGESFETTARTPGDPKVRAVYDYQNELEGGRPVKPLETHVMVGIQDGALVYGPFENDGFSAIQDTNGAIPVIQDAKNVRYTVQFDIKGLGKPILLATPYLDDVTIFWDDSQTHLLSYVFDNRTW